MEKSNQTSQKQKSRTEKAVAAAKAAGTVFAPGVSGNPGGKPVGARNRLQGKFLNALADDFEQHGVAAIAQMRQEDPSAYVRAVASLMPKELEIKRPLEELSDDDLATAIDALRSFVAAQNTDQRSRAASSGKQAGSLYTLQ